MMKNNDAKVIKPAETFDKKVETFLKSLKTKKSTQSTSLERGKHKVQVNEFVNTEIKNIVNSALKDPGERKRRLEQFEQVLMKKKIYDEHIKTKFICEYYRVVGHATVVTQKKPKIIIEEVKIRELKETPRTPKDSIKSKKMKKYSDFVLTSFSKTMSEFKSKFTIEQSPKKQPTQCIDCISNNKQFDLIERNFPDLMHYYYRVSEETHMPEYIYGTPNSLVQFGFSDNFFYAIGCNGYLLFANCLMELIDAVEIKSQDENESIVTPVKILLAIEWLIFLACDNTFSVYDFRNKKIIPIASGENISHVCLIPKYLNTIATIDTRNTIKIWNYQIPKMHKIVKSSLGSSSLISKKALALINIDHFLIHGGENYLSVVDILSCKDAFSQQFDNITAIVHLKRFVINGKTDINFFIGVFSNGDMIVYNLDCHGSVIKISHFVSCVDPNANVGSLFTVNNLLIISGGKLMKIFSQLIEKSREVPIKDRTVTITSVPQLTLIKELRMSNDISHIFETEGTIYLHGEDYIRTRSFMEIEELLKAKDEQEQSRIESQVVMQNMVINTQEKEYGIRVLTSSN